MKKLRSGRYVDLYEDNRGNLVLVPQMEELKEEAERLTEQSVNSALCDVLEDHLCNGWSMVRPEQIAALTSAPIITDDLNDDEDGKVISTGTIWWFPDYQIRNEVAELLDGKSVVFTKAD